MCLISKHLNTTCCYFWVPSIHSLYPFLLPSWGSPHLTTLWTSPHFSIFNSMFLHKEAQLTTEVFSTLRRQEEPEGLFSFHFLGFLIPSIDCSSRPPASREIPKCHRHLSLSLSHSVSRPQGGVYMTPWQVLQQILSFQGMVAEAGSGWHIVSHLGNCYECPSGLSFI